MPWRSFAVANMLGCVTWAAAVATFSYLAGRRARSCSSSSASPRRRGLRDYDDERAARGTRRGPRGRRRAARARARVAGTSPRAVGAAPAAQEPHRRAGAARARPLPLIAVRPPATRLALSGAFLAVSTTLLALSPHALMVLLPALVLAWMVTIGWFTGERAIALVRRAMRRLRRGAPPALRARCGARALPPWRRAGSSWAPSHAGRRRPRWPCSSGAASRRRPPPAPVPRVRERPIERPRRRRRPSAQPGCADGLRPPAARAAARARSSVLPPTAPGAGGLDQPARIP